MKNRNQNQKQYIIHWGNGFSDDFYSCVEDIKIDIEEALQNGDVCLEDVRVYEISACYYVGMADIKLIKS